MPVKQIVQVCIVFHKNQYYTFPLQFCMVIIMYFPNRNTMRIKQAFPRLHLYMTAMGTKEQSGITYESLLVILRCSAPHMYKLSGHYPRQYLQSDTSVGVNLRHSLSQQAWHQQLQDELTARLDKARCYPQTNSTPELHRLHLAGSAPILHLE